ncbi:FUSC family protein [Clostridium sp.]|uniref:FUSC family protein n=1 Tax=Clostridium sp. TaxID=1506 RepID=UPI00263651CD|nr:FUSC family protein [Clostridium sp.]
MIESIKKNLKPKILVNNLILIVGIILFVSLYGKVFGSSNTLIGVCVITAMLMFANVHLSLKLNEAIITTILSFVFMGFLTQISSMNIFLVLVINFIGIFIVSYLVTNTMETKAYLPFMLCYVFIEGNPVSWSEFPKRLMALLVGGILISAVYYFSHRKKDDSEHINISEMIKTMDKNSLQFNFSLRMAISVSLAMLLGSLIGAQKSMWISISAMSITQPHFEDSKTKSKERFFGTLIGAGIFLVLFGYIIPKHFSNIVLLILSYIYTFINEYKIKMIFTTMSSLGAAMILFQPGVSVPMRIIFISLGIVIALIVNKVIYGWYKLEKENEMLEEIKKEKNREIDKVTNEF